jgi:replication factor C small subunit
MRVVSHPHTGHLAGFMGRWRLPSAMSESEDAVGRDEVWIEKYRPATLDAVVGQEAITSRLSGYVEQEDLPHLLFSGPAGVGKSSAAIAIAHERYGEDWEQNFLELNASDERGIDVVRDRIKSFARSSFGGFDYRVIFLDEADSMTGDAQSALRRTMEQFSHNTRFILSCVTPDTNILLPGEREATIEQFMEQFDRGNRKHVANIREEENAVKRDLALATVEMPPGLIGKDVLKVTTMSGREIKVTADHLLRTPQGWKQAGSLNETDELVVYPHLEGTPTEHDERAIIDRSQFKQFLHESELEDGKRTLDEADSYGELATLAKARILERASELLERVEDGDGLTEREHDLYQFVVEKPGSSREQLQELIGLSRIRTVQLLRSIEEKGYVSRSLDGKTHFFTPTEKQPHRLRNKMRVRDRLEEEFNISISYSVINRMDEPKAHGRLTRVIEELEEKGLLDLTYAESRKIGALTRICGFLLGDGHVVRNNKRLYFAGNRTALANVKRDLDILGYSNHSAIQSKELENEINGRELVGTSTSFTLDSLALSHLIQHLGIPSGDKTKTPLSVPDFVNNGTLFVKREFLRAIFGCDADRPRCDRMNFEAVMLGQNKATCLEDDIQSYYSELGDLFSEFDVDTYQTVRDRGEVRQRDDTAVNTYCLVIQPNNENLYRFFSRIGYAFEPDKSELSRLAAEYLKHKIHLIEAQQEKSAQALATLDNGSTVTEAAGKVGVSTDFVRGQQKGKDVHLPRDEFVTFDSWVESYHYDGSLVLNEIHQIEQVDEPVVMDITCKDDHNFITNGLISHNCNYSSQIIDPIQSRCAVFRFSPIPDEAVADRIREIAETEGIELADDGVEALVYAADGDMRKAINALQAAAVLGDTVDEEAVYTITSTARPEDIQEMVEAALEGDFTMARSVLDELLTDQGLAGGDVIDQLHRAVWDFGLDDEAAVRLLDRIGEADYRIAEGANERLQLEALLAAVALHGED